MSKITISRLFEVSQYLATESGKELADALQYLSEFVEVTVRALRGGLTVQDNLASTVKTVNLVSGRETVVLAATAEKRRASAVMVLQIVDDTNYSMTSFGWRYNPSGDLVVKLGIENTPTAPIPVKIAILF